MDLSRSSGKSVGKLSSGAEILSTLCNGLVFMGSAAGMILKPNQIKNQSPRSISPLPRGVPLVAGCPQSLEMWLKEVMKTVLYSALL